MLDTELRLASREWAIVCGERVEASLDPFPSTLTERRYKAGAGERMP